MLIAIQGRSTLRALKERVTTHKRGEVYKRRKSIAGYNWEIPEGKADVETWWSEQVIRFPDSGEIAILTAALVLTKH
jgi:hypothetical protein